MIEYIGGALIGMSIIIVLSVRYFDKRMEDKDWRQAGTPTIILDCLAGIIAIGYYSVSHWLFMKLGMLEEEEYDGGYYDNKEDWI